jgi:hypothetical protein
MCGGKKWQAVKPEKEKSNASTLSFVKRVVVADQLPLN